MTDLARRCFAAAVLTVLVPAAALADAGDQAAQEKALRAGGAWHYKSFHCVDTTVTHVGNRLEGMKDSGTTAAFATTLGFDGVGSGSTHAGVQLYDSDPVMARERPGDRVQVCLLSVTLPINGCNPDTDLRGRTYRVYDYKRHAAYTGQNQEHDCGGA